MSKALVVFCLVLSVLFEMSLSSNLPKRIEDVDWDALSTDDFVDAMKRFLPTTKFNETKFRESQLDKRCVPLKRDGLSDEEYKIALQKRDNCNEVWCCGAGCDAICDYAPCRYCYIHCSNCGCLMDGCWDANPCTNDYCNPISRACEYTPVTCNDGNACTDESCSTVSGCVSSTRNCNDGNACTTDSCNPATGCVHAAINCNDGNACTTDSCNPSSGCVNAGISCDDGNACTTDSCNTVTGCVNTPVACSDSNACTSDSCNPASGCQFNAITCSDSNACTSDSCNPASGCVFSGITCNDGSACTTDSCNPATGCVFTTISCNDNNACTTDTCNSGFGCQHSPISCDDGNACTSDTCTTTLGCQYTGVTCNDNNPCTTDTCNSGSGCQYTPLPCADSDLCTTDGCNPANGQCTFTPRNCNDNNPCTTDSCNPANGQCINMAVNCNDNNPCTTDSCNSANGQCINALRNCDDNNPCTDDSCNAGNGQCVNAIRSGSCPDDGDLCTLDLCSGGVCTHPGKCSAGDQCNTVSCAPTVGTCVTTPRTGVTCADDGNGCTDDVCNAQGVCTHPAHSRTCADDGNPCTNDFCNGGSCTHPFNTNNCTSTAGACYRGVCSSGTCADVFICRCTTNAECNDNNPCTNDVCQTPGVTTGNCVYTHNTANCDDGVYCNGADSCSGGTCSVHAGSPCASNSDRCAQICNEAGRTCRAPNGQSCDNGVFCDGVDTCVNGVCTSPGNPCSSGGPCASTCNETNRNCFALSGVTCPSDGTFCNGPERCDGRGACVSTGNPCNTDCMRNCDESRDRCEVLVGTQCDDGLWCNGADLCDPNGGCTLHYNPPCNSTGACGCNDVSRQCFADARAPCGTDFCFGEQQCDGQGACRPVNPTFVPCDEGCTCDRAGAQCVCGDSALQGDDAAGSTMIIGASAGAGALLCCLVILLVVFLVRRRKQRRQDGDSKEVASLTLAGNNGAGSHYASSSSIAKLGSSNGALQYGSTQYKSIAALQKVKVTSALMQSFGTSQWAIPFARLKVANEIGSGSFGVVYRATLDGQAVAVKALRGEINDKFLQEAKRETDIMSVIPEHPNVVRFFGICVDPFCMITELMANGSLFDYLQKNKADDAHLLSWVRDIAHGMAHLHANGVIHRDLATRNVLLSGEFQAKITDFGMSRTNSNPDGGQNQTKSTVGPLKYMPPESLLNSVYSYASDAWAYGITIIEIALRDTPYPGREPVEAAASVVQGFRHPIPEDLSFDIQEVIRLCFETNPQARPSFVDICQRLEYTQSFRQ